MSKGLIYCVRNPLFPHLVKIGKTEKKTVEERGLNLANVPEDFEIIFAYQVDNIDSTERAVHNAVEELRFRSEKTTRKTEFFYACAAKKAEAVVRPFKIGDYTSSKLNTMKVARDNILDYPTTRYKEYVDLAKRLLELGRQSEFGPIKKIDEINRSASTKWTKLNNIYAIRTNHSSSNLVEDIKKLNTLLLLG
jgi:hypothetical protein